MTEATEVVRINSVQIEDNSRGTTITAKAYGLTIQEAEDEAVASIQRLRARLKSISQLQVIAPQLLETVKLFIDDDDPCRIVPGPFGEACDTHRVALPCRVAVARSVIALAEGTQS